jgi:DNA invertase Pin-like site-specific DNA recombinase
MVRWSTLCRLGQIRAWENGVRWGGSKPGWRWKVTDEQIATIREMKAAGKKVSHIAKAMGLSRPTIYRWLNNAASNSG